MVTIVTYVPVHDAGHNILAVHFATHFGPFTPQKLFISLDWTEV